MKTKYKAGILAIGVLGAGFGVWAWLDSYDRFHLHQLKLAADKETYRPGESIRLLATVTPARPARIRVYRERHKSLSLLVRAATTQGPDMADNDFWRRAAPIPRDAVDVLEITPQAPLVVEIHGTILVS